jgi:hypothetical protein
MRARHEFLRSPIPINELLVIRFSFLVVAIMFLVLVGTCRGSELIVPSIFSVPLMFVQGWLSFGGSVPRLLGARVRMSRVEFVSLVGVVSLVVSLFLGVVFEI